MANRIVELKEQIHTYVSKNGPILPYPVAKEFKGTTLFISALLSELVSTKKIKLSKAKIGGSPLYYAPHQEDNLYGKLRSHIGKKQQEALDMLKDKHVLRDRDLLPVERVSLRDLPDFAKPVRLVLNNTEELFWKWHTFPDIEAKTVIENILQDVYKPELVKEEIKVVEQTVTASVQPLVEVQLEKPIPVEETVEIELEPESIVELPKPELPKPKKKLVKKKKAPESQITLQKNKVAAGEDEFLDQILNHLSEKGIIVEQSTLVKKNRESNLLVIIPSNVGELKYFVKARNRKKLNEGDILLAFTESQNNKLPLLYISNAELTNKAKEYISKNLPGMTYIKI
tara:strand:- start:6168 stop:7193 length:1026 start_codon:yes stop_codon:yes gene_type:complete